MLAALYDEIGRGYSSRRHPDPRIATAIRAALGDARTVLNVGAGAGAYEPPDLDVTAVEPSPVMVAQRPAGAARVVEASAEALPFPDNSFDAAMAVLSDHHWTDRDRGLRELRRVARGRVVLFNANPGEAGRFWLSTEYLPEFLELIPSRYRARGAWEQGLRSALGRAELTAVPIPHDCADGFYGAHWRRPSAYLDPSVRAGVSVFSRIPEGAVTRGIAALDADLASGAWARRHRDLLEMDSLDLGYYVVVCEADAAG